MDYPRLLEPGRIGRVELKNRAFVPPMGTRLNREGAVTAADIAFYERRARGGIGLVITGATAAHVTTTMRGRTLLEAYSKHAIPSMKERIDAVHRHGAALFGQILHLGRETPGQSDQVTLAPSPVPSPRDFFVPKAMTHDEIAAVVEGFADAARNLQFAGADGVEIHGAHGYLVAQFLSMSSNLRSDKYGRGSIAARSRFLVEVVAAIRSACGDDFPVGVRLSAVEEIPDGLDIESTSEIVAHLQAEQPIDYISVTQGVRSAYVKDSSAPENIAVPAAAALRKIVDVPILVSQRIRTADDAEQILASGSADFVGMGRAAIADPDWLLKAQAGQATRIRPCIGIVQDCRTSLGSIKCAVNAQVGRELTWTEAAPVSARSDGRVYVVGGGPAGLEAARVAASRGHEVVLLERQERLGGQLLEAMRLPARAEIGDYISYLEREMQTLGVDVRTETEMAAEELLAENPSLIVVATGAAPTSPEFPVSNRAAFLDTADVLAGHGVSPAGRTAVVDDGTGFWQGISAAEVVAATGDQVLLVTSARAVALAIPHESVSEVHKRLASADVEFLCFSQIVSVDPGRLVVRDVLRDTLTSIDVDRVVWTSRRRPRTKLLNELRVHTGVADHRPKLVGIGDASSPRQLTHAILEANLAIDHFERGELQDLDVVLF